MKRSRKTRSIRIISCFLILALFAGCGGSAGSTGNTNDDVITLKLGHTLAVTSHYEAGVQHFAELVYEKSGGTIVIESYPGSVLGGERDMMEGMQMGTVDMCISASAPLGGFNSEMMLFDLPFLFRDHDHAWAVADGEIGTKILDDLEDIGVVGLAYWENGFRHIYSNFPIESPNDLTGKKIRVMENSVHMGSFEALGSIPTPMAYAELFTALQQGTIDGAENAIIVIATDKFYEVCDYLALTGHFWSTVPLLMSKQVYDKLTPEQQGIIEEAAIEARDWQRAYTLENEAKYLQELKDAGMTVTEVSQEEFRALCEPIYSQFYDSIPQEMIEAVINS